MLYRLSPRRSQPSELPSQPDNSSRTHGRLTYGFDSSPRERRVRSISPCLYTAGQKYTPKSSKPAYDQLASQISCSTSLCSPMLQAWLRSTPARLSSSSTSRPPLHNHAVRRHPSCFVLIESLAQLDNRIVRAVQQSGFRLDRAIVRYS
jgi:hypothetical protein